MRNAFFSLIIMLAVIPFHSNGQIIKRYKPYPQPNIVLVRLPTYTDKIALYERRNDTRRAKQMQKDAQNMQRVMVADFKKDFTFCTYYFFYDTSNKAILERDFTGRLYDKDLKPINASPIADGDTTYQIIYFGQYPSSFNSGDGEEYAVGMRRDRLVLVNHRFERLPSPVPNGTITAYSNTVSIFRRNNLYTSKLFDVYYTKYSAWTLSWQMDGYYNKKQIR